MNEQLPGDLDMTAAGTCAMSIIDEWPNLRVDVTERRRGKEQIEEKKLLE